jgi:hypothetical protein
MRFGLSDFDQLKKDTPISDPAVCGLRLSALDLLSAFGPSDFGFNCPYRPAAAVLIRTGTGTLQTSIRPAWW